MTQKRNARLTRQQIVNIGSTLEQCLKKSDKEGFFEYQDGWSDQRIGSANGATDTQVASLRKELFGELKRQYNGVNPLATAWERIKRTYTIRTCTALGRCDMNAHQQSRTWGEECGSLRSTCGKSGVLAYVAGTGLR